MKKHITGILATLAVVFLMASCSSGATYSIDNPTENEIQVSIDGKDPISVGAKELKKMDGSLSLGEHTMKVGDGQEVKFNLDKDHVMLNPTLSTYVKVLQEYGVGIQSTANDTIINIDGKEFNGPFPLVSSEAFIYTGDLNYQVDKPFSDEITTSKSGTVVMKKLFRKDEFKKFYKDEYE